MQKIKVWFCDFYPSWKNEDNFIINVLRKKFDVILDRKKPEYVFYSVFGYSHLKYNCIRIFYTGENVFPDFNICDYAIGIHDIKINDRYLHYPLYLIHLKETLEERKQLTQNDLNLKKRFCNFIYSHTEGERTEFFKMLNKYKKVDSPGKAMNNLGYVITNKYKFQKECKFSIAFENEKYLGYCTEKIMDAFKANTIPIYFGDENIEEIINPKAFINCKSIDDFENTINKVIKLDNDDNMYLEMVNASILNNENLLKEKEYELEMFLYNIIGSDIRRPNSKESIRKEMVVKLGSLGLHIKHKLHSIKIKSKIK